MNIFYLSNDPYECAKFHMDKHTIKMILEYAQLLSTTHRVLDGTIVIGNSISGRKKTIYKMVDTYHDSKLYAATHINHPSTVWVRQSSENYIWLSNMLLALCKEYTHRYDKIHKVEREGLCNILHKNIPHNIGNNGFTEPTTAMPDNVKITGDSIASYRNYYSINKRHLASWKNRSIPEWYTTTID